jgi:hypothetical protein
MMTTTKTYLNVVHVINFLPSFFLNAEFRTKIGGFFCFWGCPNDVLDREVTGQGLMGWGAPCWLIFPFYPMDRA